MRPDGCTVLVMLRNASEWTFVAENFVSRVCEFVLANKNIMRRVMKFLQKCSEA
jgi:hypothetical protein